MKLISNVNKTVSFGKINVILEKGKECKIRGIEKSYPGLFSIIKDETDTTDTTDTIDTIEEVHEVTDEEIFSHSEDEMKEINEKLRYEYMSFSYNIIDVITGFFTHIVKSFKKA